MSFGFGVGDFLAVLKLANEVRKQFANAPKEFKDISDDVESLSLAIVNADFRVEHARSHGAPVETVSPVLMSCQALLLELQTFNTKHSVLQKDPTDGTKTKFKRFWKRASWDSNEIRDFRHRIVSNVLLLNKLEQRHIHSDVKSLLRQQIEHRRSQVVDWISPIDFGNKQRDLLSERVDDISGTWILTTEQYATWIKDGGRTLFCWGMPGGGKTMTTAMVVDHLQSLCKGDGEILVAYIYCRYQSHDQSASQLLESILRSLIRQSPKVPDMVINKLFEEYNAKGEVLPSHQVSPAISAMLTSARSKYIVIDAVDELDDSQRAILLQRLFSLKEITEVNLLLTSRQQPKATTETFNAHFGGPSGMHGALKNLVQGLQALGTPSKVDDFLLDLDVEIRATDRDVERYLRAEQNLMLLPKCVKERPHLQEEVISSIIRVVDGMFLLAVLHLQSLKRKTTVKQVKDALQNMTEPSGSHAYDRAYDDALQRIESQADELKDLAKNALSILMCARQSLSPDDLCHALSVDVTTEEADEDNVPDIEDVLKSCAGLVTVDHESDCVRLVHNSTQEYMDRNRVSKFPDALKYVEAVCVVYYNVKSKSNPGGPFYEYSGDNRWYHWKLAEQDREFRKKLVGNRISDRLVSTEKPTFSLSMATGMERFWQQAAMKTTLQSVIQKGCKTGDLDLLESFLDTSQYEKSNDVAPLLQIALEAHQHRIVKLLLGRSAKPTPSAFLTAVQWNNVEGLKLLVKFGSPEVIETSGSTLLLAASEMGHISAMKYLVRLPGINLTQTDQYSRNALHLASISGKTEAVHFLLQHLTATISAVDEDGRTALHYAVMRGHGLITRLLLPRASSDILREDFEILSPLDHAVRLDSISMVETLIDSMLPDDPLRHKSAALLHSVSECPRQFNALLDQHNQHMTPRQSKLHLPRIEILQILLSSGYFNLNLGDHSGRTVLHIAVDQPYWLSDPLSSARDAARSRLNLLLNTTGINVNARDDEERTPKSYVRDAQLVAARGYNLEEFIDQARTPGFDVMMESRNTEREVEETMLQMLIDAGAEY